jgi:hypothetical protein
MPLGLNEVHPEPEFRVGIKSLFFEKLSDLQDDRSVFESRACQGRPSRCLVRFDNRSNTAKSGRLVSIMEIAGYLVGAKSSHAVATLSHHMPNSRLLKPRMNINLS